MRICDLTEAILSMSELAEIMPAITQHMANLDRAQVSVSGPSSITLDTQWNNQSLQVTYQLKSGDAEEFRRQLVAALRSSRSGAELGRDVNVVRAIDHSILRKNALNYLTNPARWHAVRLRLAGQIMPAPAALPTK